MITFLIGCDQPIEAQPTLSGTDTNVLSTIIAATPTATPLIEHNEKPGSASYPLQLSFSDPLFPSEENPGPHGCTELEACGRACQNNTLVECRDWVQSIYLYLDTTNQIHITGKFNGLWMPTIDAVRNAARLIPQLKADGVNSVSFGPDIVTRKVENPRTVGDNLFRFYVKIFEDAGFNVNLVPNNMHWGNDDVYLQELDEFLLTWAGEAEQLQTRFFTAFNEVDGMRDLPEDTSLWIQEMLPLIKERYSGDVCVQPTQRGFKGSLLDYSGYDCVASLFSLMVPDVERNSREFVQFTKEAQHVKDAFPPVKYIFLTDLSTFSGGLWAETGLMEAQARAMERDDSEYSDDQEQVESFRMYFEKAYPFIDGSFFNILQGFSFIDRPAEEVLKEHFLNAGQVLPTKATDILWSTPGLLELIERITLDEQEKELIFDLDTFVDRPTAGLCFEPTKDTPGPFGCASTDECMALFKANPEEYWWWRIEHCKED